MTGETIITIIGNLTADNLALIEDMAREHDCQVWIERVSDPSESAVVIEDGEVVSMTPRRALYVIALDRLAHLYEQHGLDMDDYPELTTEDQMEVAEILTDWADRRSIEARDEALDTLTAGMPDEWDEADRQQAERQDATAWDDDPHAHPDTDPHEDMLDAADHDRQEP